MDKENKYSDFVGGVGVGQFDDGSEVDWRAYDPPETDDELLEETPADVLAILGFDPREFMTDAEKAFEKKKKKYLRLFKSVPVKKENNDADGT